MNNKITKSVDFKNCFLDLPLKEIIKEHPKSKILVSEASNTGEFPFYNSSSRLSMSHNSALLSKNKILLSTGGKAGVHFSNKDFSYSSDVYVIESGNINAKTKFLYYWLISSIKKVERCFEGSGLKHLNKNYLKRERVNLPEVDYQDKIIELLEKKESHLKSIQILISKMEQRNQYYFDKIFLGDYETDGQDVVFIDDGEKEEMRLNRKGIEVSSRFSKKKIPEMISLKKGVSIKKENFNYEGNGIRYLRTSDVWEDSSSKKEEVYYEGDNKGLVFKTNNDWIICFDGFNKKPKKGTLGLVTNRGEGYCSGELHMIEGIEGVSTKYVNIALLRSSYFQDLICRYGEGTTVKHAGKHVKTIELPYIPYEEQLVLNSTVKKMLDEVDLLKELYSKEKQVFQWLCEKLVSGEYRIEN
jgi:restriction endonuclease S subunit